MMLVIPKNKFSVYKKFDVDVWGVFKSSLILKLKKFELLQIYDDIKRWSWSDVRVSKKTDWIGRYFYSRFLDNIKQYRIFHSMYYYRFDIDEPENYVLYKKLLKKSSIGIKIVELFYLLVSKKRLRKFIRIARKRSGLYSSNYLYLLECRIILLVYRSTVLSNIFESLRFIKNCNIIVNNKFELLPNKSIKLFSLIDFRFLFKGYLYWVLMKRLKRYAVFFNIPRYIYFSYQFLFFFIINVPKKKDIIYPFSLDVFKIIDFNMYIK